MKIGIVTTWFERGAAYVSRQYRDVLAQKHEVFIYARGGEKYGRNDPVWDAGNIWWGKRLVSKERQPVYLPDFQKWIRKTGVEIILFNEQVSLQPVILASMLGIKTVAYIDYYTQNTIPLFGLYDALICNTKRHYSVFNWHPCARYIQWGTDPDIYMPKPREKDRPITIFHSAGMNPYRKGTDFIIKAMSLTDAKSSFRAVIHTQVNLPDYLDDEAKVAMRKLVDNNRLTIVEKSVSAPGLYHMGDIYVYPSRLDGIGLSVAEALACGLPSIVTDSGPMNEFVERDWGDLVPVEKMFARSDGYYWPITEVSPQNLARVIESQVAKVAEDVDTARYKARAAATEKFDWRKNAASLPDVFESIIKNKALFDETLPKYGKWYRENTDYVNRFWNAHPVLFDLLASGVTGLRRLNGEK